MVFDITILSKNSLLDNTIVLFNSIINNTRDLSAICINILWLDEEQFPVSRFAHSENVRIIKLSPENLSEKNIPCDASLDLLKAYVPVLRNETEYTLCLDSNILAVSDILQLEQMRPSGPIAAVKKYVSYERCKRLGLPYNSLFSTGILYYNTRNWVTEKYFDKISKMVQSSKNSSEYILNKIFTKKVEYLPCNCCLPLKTIFEGDLIDELYGLNGLFLTQDFAELLNSSIFIDCDKFVRPYDVFLPVFSDRIKCSSDGLIRLIPSKAYRILPIRSLNDTDAISVVIDLSKSYSSEKLKCCINSLIYQTLRPKEISVYIPNVSNGLPEILAEYPEIKVITKEVPHISAEYVIVLYPEDRLIQTAVQFMVNDLNSNKDLYVYNSYMDNPSQTYFDQIDTKHNLASESFDFSNSFGLITYLSGRRSLLVRSLLITSWNNFDRIIVDNIEQGNYLLSDSALFISDISEDYRQLRYALLKTNPSSPKVSVVIPVYNGSEYLCEALDSLVAQSFFSETEIIVVNDCSSDSTLSILLNYYHKNQITLINFGTNYGPGPARNIGFSYSSGEYLIYLDADDIFDSEMIKKMYCSAEKYNSELVYCRSNELDDKTGKIEYNPAMYRTELMAGLKNPFNFKDIPQYIFNIVNGWAWDKLIKRSLILEHGLKFENLRRNQDMAFSYMAMVYAKSIYFIDEPLIIHRRNIASSQEKKAVVYPYTVYEVCLAWKNYLENAGLFEELYQSYANRVISALSYTVKLCRINPELTQELKSKISKEILPNLKLDIVHEAIYYEFAKGHLKLIRECVSNAEQSENRQKQSYSVYNLNSDILSKIIDVPIIVSLTSYPARIGNVVSTIKSLLNQSYRPTHIQLWLAEEEFARKTDSIPDELKISDPIFEIKWCDDLKPHKKYYYAMKENPDAIIITVDDDVIYEPLLVEKLLNSYIRFPKCVSAMRVNLMTADRKGKINPYRKWERDYNASIFEPRFDLLATGVGGILYPPGLISKTLFDKELIKSTCLYADDLWLKYNEVISEIPVVHAHPEQLSTVISGSQENALYLQNLTENKNDQQFAAILDAGRRDLFEIRIFSKVPDINSKPCSLNRDSVEIKNNYTESEEIVALKQSISYRIGRAITYVPRKLLKLE